MKLKIHRVHLKPYIIKLDPEIDRSVSPYRRYICSALCPVSPKLVLQAEQFYSYHDIAMSEVFL